MNPLSVAIGIPNTGTIHTKTVSSLVGVIRTLPCPNALLMQEGSVLHWNREELVKAAKRLNATHILFVDDDMANRQLVRSIYPEVLTVDLPEDPALYSETLRGLTVFNTLP